MVVLVVSSISINAQDVSLSGGLVSAHEFIGQNIKSGTSVKFAIDFDFFNKKKFHLGPTFSVSGLSALSAGEDSIPAVSILGAGLLTGFEAGRFAYKGGVTYSFTDLFTDVNVAYTPTLNNVIEYQFKKDGLVGIRLGHDYFFNQNLFHYTHQTTLGLVLKFN